MKKIFPLNLSLCYCRQLAFMISVCCLLTSQPTGAQQSPPHRPRHLLGETLSLTAGSTFMYDSNVFRLSSLLDPVLLTGQPQRSDQIIITSATLSFNKTYAMQRFEVSGTLVDNRYFNFDFLDFLGKNYTAAWHWHITPYLYGRLSSAHSEALNNFAGLTGFANSVTRNLRTTDNFHFEGTFQLNRAWHIIGGLNHTVIKNSRVTFQDFDHKVSSVEGGIRYAFSSGSSLTYKVRSGQGEFINRPAPLENALYDTRFDDMEHELRLAWPVTGKTAIDARVGYFLRDHVHFPQRDFEGFVGNFNVNWAPTGKTRVTAGWARQLGNFQTAPIAFLLDDLIQRFSSSYIVTDRFSIAPVWQITDKTALRLRYDFVMSDFHGAVDPNAALNRSDLMHSALIAFDWRPLNALFLSASLHRDHRSSNLRGYDFDSSAASVSATLNF
jgi:exopolysaccharide biosynthesis operon protein EpsL